ncbi:MAG: hypothetical protein HOI70_01760 [Opitutae bacterium]|nr:hypothetical protein [Opitutae bacterium]
MIPAGSSCHLYSPSDWAYHAKVRLRIHLNGEVTAVQISGATSKTSGKPFPKWEKNIDQDGNRLVKPSWPCPQDKEYVPTLNQDDIWLRAVHALVYVAR